MIIITLLSMALVTATLESTASRMSEVHLDLFLTIDDKESFRCEASNDEVCV